MSGAGRGQTPGAESGADASAQATPQDPGTTDGPPAEPETGAWEAAKARPRRPAEEQRRTPLPSGPSMDLTPPLAKPRFSD